MKRTSYRWAAGLLFVIYSLLASVTHAGELCDLSYESVRSWGAGASHRINVTYHGPAINSWQMSWEFPGDETIRNLWGGQHEQSGNKVTVKSTGWNSRLKEGSAIRVGFNIQAPTKGQTAKVLFNGVDCSAEVDGEDNIPDTPDTPDTPDEPDIDIPVENDADWSLDSEQSFLHFVSYKNTNRVESHKFEKLTGSVDASTGNARLEIDLDSVNTANATRDGRLKNLLFETALFGKAVISLSIDPDSVASLNPGERVKLPVSASLALHGVEGAVETSLFVQRLTDSRVMIQNVSPVLIKAADYSLDAGIEALRKVANLDVISTTVPVDFVLYFDMQSSQ